MKILDTGKKDSFHQKSLKRSVFYQKGASNVASKPFEKASNERDSHLIQREKTSVPKKNEKNHIFHVTR